MAKFVPGEGTNGEDGAGQMAAKAPPTGEPEYNTGRPPLQPSCRRRKARDRPWPLGPFYDGLLNGVFGILPELWRGAGGAGSALCHVTDGRHAGADPLAALFIRFLGLIRKVIRAAANVVTRFNAAHGREQNT